MEGREIRDRPGSRPKGFVVVIKHLAEKEFVQNYFKHNNWKYEPFCFRFNGTRYTPDFYDKKRNVFIEVVGTRQAFSANKDKYLLFTNAFPHISLEFRNRHGAICRKTIEGRKLPSLKIYPSFDLEKLHKKFEKELENIDYGNIRKATLKRLKIEANTSKLIPLAKRIKMSHVTLWRIVKGKSKGSTINWDKIFAYYKK